MQLKLTDRELERMGRRIQEDFDSAATNHRRRMDRFQRYYRLWRGRVDPPEATERNVPNFQVPLLKWQVFGQWARIMQALLGDDAQIVAEPQAPHDEKIVHKISRYMTWRFLKYMKATSALAIFAFRAIVFGRAHAYAPWRQDVFTVRAQGVDREEIGYDGPSFEPLWPDDLLVPAEDVRSIQEFSWVIRKHRVTPQQLRDGEKAGRYQGIAENWDIIVSWAFQRQERGGSDQIKAEKDWAEGVTYDSALGARDSLICWEWYGKWRLPRTKADAREDNVDRRQENESELVVRYLPDLTLVVGVQDLKDVYPRQQYRRPFVEAALVEDGSYWGPGFGEMLEDIDKEVTVNHNLFTQAGQFSVGPVIFYKPGGGFDPDVFKYEPGVAIPTEDPGAVNVVTLNANLEYPILKEQALKGYGEMVTGVSDQTMGRTSGRPNEPRTATGQVALLEQGNVRASLDMTILRDYLGKMLQHFWQLDTHFASEQVFFRATEEDAKGLFETKGGFGTLTADERNGNFDFTLKFATSVWSGEAEKQRVIERYQLDLGNPLIVNNPTALWAVTNEAHRAMGDSNFADIVPRPPDLDRPRSPKEEWAMALQGEDFEVNSLDNDELHLIDHYRRLEEAKRQLPDRRDRDSENRMVAHVLAHQDQKRQKMLMQALTSKLASNLVQNVGLPLAAIGQLAAPADGEGGVPPGGGSNGAA